jgi:hypothetical protein
MLVGHLADLARERQAVMEAAALAVANQDQRFIEETAMKAETALLTEAAASVAAAAEAALLVNAATNAAEEGT